MISVNPLLLRSKLDIVHVSDSSLSSFGKGSSSCLASSFCGLGFSLLRLSSGSDERGDSRGELVSELPSLPEEAGFSLFGFSAPTSSKPSSIPLVEEFELVELSMPRNELSTELEFVEL